MEGFRGTDLRFSDEGKLLFGGSNGTRFHGAEEYPAVAAFLGLPLNQTMEWALQEHSATLVKMDFKDQARRPAV